MCLVLKMLSCLARHAYTTGERRAEQHRASFAGIVAESNDVIELLRFFERRPETSIPNSHMTAIASERDVSLTSKIVEMVSRWRQNAEYWKQLPAFSNARFLGAVFCLVASFSFIWGRDNLTSNICFALVNGFAATLWVVTGTRRMFNTMGIVGCLQAAANIWLVTVFSKGRSIPALQFASFEQHDALFNAAVASVLVGAGYSLFLYSFITEGRRYFDALTEIRLAGAIHRSLVPEIEAAVNPFEFYGCSWPSGEVGGDLVDLVQYDRGWFAYVADVSGHGVPAGVLMTMVKSAARTWLAAVGPCGFLPALNQVLLPLSAPNMYVTLAFLCYTRTNMELATAGHVPILHFDGLAKTVRERCVSNFPVALISDVSFEVSEIFSEPGDVFVFLTDGMTEVVDDHDRDLGLEPLKSVLIENAGAPLPELASRLRHRALEHGKQTDDQTLLLIRHSRAI